MPTGSGAINEKVKELLSVFVRSKSPDYLLPQVLIEAVSNKIRFLYINRNKVPCLLRGLLQYARPF